MEQQFILRLKGKLKGQINLEESSLEFIDDNNAQLIYKETRYPGIVVKLPCIVESQKTFDTQQYYKISDISTLVIIYPDNNYDFDYERRVAELSGITPPMKFAKSRRFTKKSDKIQIVEEIEKKLQEIIERDNAATDVEIMHSVDKEISDEISNIAAEIETNLESIDHSKNLSQEVVTNDNLEIQEDQEIIDLKNEIEIQQKLVDGALNPILKKRFETKLNELKSKLADLNKR